MEKMMMLKRVNIWTLCAVVTVLGLNSCANSTQVKWDTVYYEPQYAEGFDIAGMNGSESRVIRVYDAWQRQNTDNQARAAKELLILRNDEDAPSGYPGQIVNGDVRRLAIMSSTHYAMLELLDKTDILVAIDSKSNIDAGNDEIIEIGSDVSPDYEALTAAEPELILIYGISGESPMEQRLRSLGIPYLYIGDYLEADPLGKPEWLVVMGEVLGCRTEAEDVFRAIANSYEELRDSLNNGYLSSKKSDIENSFINGSNDDSKNKGSNNNKSNDDAQNDKSKDNKTKIEGKRPKVMLNLPYRDIWYMPSSRNAFARIINDAGGEYIWTQDTGNQSTPISFEEAFGLVSEADYWINPSQAESIREIVEAYPVFRDVKCIREGRVFNCNKRVNVKGANEYWGMGQLRPDLVLRDLATIFGNQPCQPQAVQDSNSKDKKDRCSEEDLVYYQRLH